VLGGFEAQTTKPVVSITPRACPPRSGACPASPQQCRQHGPLHHILMQVHVLGVNHRGWSPDCSDPSVKTQHSPFTAPSASARAHMTFTSAVGHRSCAPHLHTTSRPTWLHKHNLTLVRPLTTPECYPLAITHHQIEPQGTSQPCVRNKYVLHIMLFHHNSKSIQ
jgi:hypothetical protein